MILAGVVPGNAHTQGIRKQARRLLPRASDERTSPSSSLSCFHSGRCLQGKYQGAFKERKDVARALGQAMADMGPYIALIFVSAQFLKYFEWSNMGIILLQIKGRISLEASGLPIPVVLVLFIIMCALINMLIGGRFNEVGNSLTYICTDVYVSGISSRIGADGLQNRRFHYKSDLSDLRLLRNASCPVTKYDKNAGFGTLMANIFAFIQLHFSAL